jgi:imidazoleglycerol-phosphate dehydratase
LGKAEHGISTGIGFFDHMLDQLNSHAQVGVSVTVSAPGIVATEDVDTGKNRHASLNQPELMATVGTALGAKLKQLLLQSSLGDSAVERKSRFCCPLDEALVECILTYNGNDEEGSLESFRLAPYGIYPVGTGRTKIGQMETKGVQPFFDALAVASSLKVELRKVRGDNGHHVCESAFKAFSRGLRNLLDHADTNTENMNNGGFQSLWGVDSDGYKAGLALEREGTVERKTRETAISVQLQMDGGKTGIQIDTGLSSLNQFMELFAKESQLLSLSVKCNGDTWVDDHHTSEDVSIALGQVLNKAFGTKAGLNRMWCAMGSYGDARVEVTMDLSNRPCLTHNLTLSQSGEEFAGDLSVEMVDHVLESLVMNAAMTVHIVELTTGATVLETLMATAMAFGRALRLCASIDPRRAGATASSKGTLSV